MIMSHISNAAQHKCSVFVTGQARACGMIDAEQHAVANADAAAAQCDK